MLSPNLFAMAAYAGAPNPLTLVTPLLVIDFNKVLRN